MDRPEVVDLTMDRAVFTRVQEYLEANFPVYIYKMPDEAQEPGITSYGVALNTA